MLLEDDPLMADVDAARDQAAAYELRDPRLGLLLRTAGPPGAVANAWRGARPRWVGLGASCPPQRKGPSSAPAELPHL